MQNCKRYAQNLDSHTELARTFQGPGKSRKIKPSRAFAIRSVSALFFFLVFNPLKGYADALLSMEVTGVQGTAYGDEDVYPYYGSANGNPVTLMCISYTADMGIGETWTADEAYLPMTPEYEEAAWLFTDANTAIAAGNTAEQIADQWAAWELFSPSAYNNPPSGTDTQMALAVTDYESEPASFYQNFILYVPIPGSQSEYGTAQNFLGYRDETPDITPDVLPEPSSLVLLGSGVVSLATSLYRKRRSARRGSPASA